MTIPNGTAVTIAMAVVKRVPDRRGNMPYRFCVNNGVHSVSKRKSLRGTIAKNPQDSETKTQIMPSVVRIVTSPQKASNFSITISLVFFNVAVRS